MFEKEAEEYGYRCACLMEDIPIIERAYRTGAEYGYNKAMKEWRDCFMSCSSPYCADKFRDIQCGGMLGNMTKEVAE